MADTITADGPFLRISQDDDNSTHARLLYGPNITCVQARSNNEICVVSWLGGGTAEVRASDEEVLAAWKKALAAVGS